ncbi:hypothetical protein ES703_93788 [subsurface metagenome]
MVPVLPGAFGVHYKIYIQVFVTPDVVGAVTTKLYPGAVEVLTEVRGEVGTGIELPVTKVFRIVPTLIPIHAFHINLMRSESQWHIIIDFTLAVLGERTRFVRLIIVSHKGQFNVPIVVFPFGLIEYYLIYD